MVNNFSHSMNLLQLPSLTVCLRKNHTGIWRRPVETGRRILAQFHLDRHVAFKFSRLWTICSGTDRRGFHADLAISLSV